MNVAGNKQQNSVINIKQYKGWRDLRQISPEVRAYYKYAPVIDVLLS